MVKTSTTKKYDLEERTFKFSQAVRLFVDSLPRTISSIEDAKQLVRSSGSIGANYIEANESLSKKDFLLRIKICRKEAKESEYWLKLIKSSERQQTMQQLLDEAGQLRLIFSPIINNSTK